MICDCNYAMVCHAKSGPPFLVTLVQIIIISKYLDSLDSLFQFCCNFWTPRTKFSDMFGHL